MKKQYLELLKISHAIYGLYQKLLDDREENKDLYKGFLKQLLNKEENLYFVFGKESTGIPPTILKPHLDHCMRMPMTDKVRALNLSNTVAIMVYEALRQQEYNDLLKDEPHKGPHFIEEYEEENKI